MAEEGMVGRTIWAYDVNRRCYERDGNNRSVGSPIFRKSWVKVEIVGETRVSWLLRNGVKIPKRDTKGFAFSEEELDQICYVHDNSYKIAEVVRRLKYTDLKKVADIIGYKAK